MPRQRFLALSSRYATRWQAQVSSIVIYGNDVSKKPPPSLTGGINRKKSIYEDNTRALLNKETPRTTPQAQAHILFLHNYLSMHASDAGRPAPSRRLDRPCKCAVSHLSLLCARCRWRGSQHDEFRTSLEKRSTPPSKRSSILTTESDQTFCSPQRLP